MSDSTEHVLLMGDLYRYADPRNGLLGVRCECPSDHKATGESKYTRDWFAPEEYKVAVPGHRANECPGDFKVWRYERGGNVIALCSCCCPLSGRLPGLTIEAAREIVNRAHEILTSIDGGEVPQKENS